MKTLDYIILVLIIIGAVNWGLIMVFPVRSCPRDLQEICVCFNVIYAQVGV